MSEKIHEKLVTIRIKTWAEQNAIFNIQQNGFRKNRCINDSLFKSKLSIKQNSNKTMIYTAVSLMWRKLLIKYGINDYPQNYII